uniref:Endolytic murein transglycosylase n=1 Tax=candidate division WWE3 bacterium TaxID=2053526 RepID=A0A7C4XHR4_UNCKA
MDQADPKRYIVLNSSQKKMALLFVFIGFFVVFPILGYFYYEIGVERPAQGFKETVFEIEEGESVSAIAKRLNERGLVNSELLFTSYLIRNNLQSKIQAGVYQIPPGASVKELANIFQFGTNDVKLTFIEGWRAEEYARYAASKLKRVDYEEFLKLAKNKEGQLFPDTYYMNIESDEAELVEKLTQTFDAKTKDLFVSPEFNSLGLTKSQVINFASTVEREINTAEDRPVVAGILIKRFKNNELIGADATVQYAVAEKNFCATQDNPAECPNKEQINQIDWWPGNIFAEDLEFDSPYNTRKNLGLPPSPIANPGIESIKAVIYNVPTTYNYYLTDAEGKAHYAETLAQHNENINQFLK